LPEANYLPPVRCGDLFRILQKKPKIIAIIDGIFESMAAVWHKEILLCLERGIIIFGASSMGALRAVELADYGMIGVGKIFEAYQSGELNDDDEVAVMHSSANDYTVLTDAMVNIRASINNAVEMDILSKKDADLMLKVAKKLFYKERDFERVLIILASMGVDEDIINNFTLWLEKGGYVDLKKQDAIFLLEYLASVNKKKLSLSHYNAIKVNRSVFLRTICRRILCCSIEFDEIPKRVEVISRYHQDDYKLTINLAFLLSAASGLARARNIHVNEVIKSSTLKNKKLFLTEDQFYFYRNSNDMDNNNYINRINKIECLLNDVERENPHFHNIISNSFVSFLKLRGVYVSYKKEFTEFKVTYQYRALKLISTIWALFESEIKNKKVILKEEIIKRYSIKFSKQYNLTDPQLLTKWLNENDCNNSSYYALMRFYANYSFFILEKNLEILGIFEDEDHFWLLDAMQLSNLYLPEKLT